jgi:MoxR-like ATPase
MVKARIRPVIVLTSNAKRELSDPFLRRCFCHHIAFPSPEQMREIVDLHFPDLDHGLLDAALGIFYELRQRGYEKPPATSELLSWLGALNHARITPDRLNVPFIGTLLKRTEDILSFRSGGKRARVN